VLFNDLHACDFVHILCSLLFYVMVSLSFQLLGSPGWWGSDSSSSGKSGKSGSGKSGKSGGDASSSSSGDWGK